MKTRDILPILVAGQALVVLLMLVLVITQVSLSRAVWRVEKSLRAHARAHAQVPTPDGHAASGGAETQRLPRR